MPRSRRKYLPVRLRRSAVSWQFEWTDELVELLGVLPDAKVAAKAGIRLQAVADERRRRGIPPARPRRPPIEWTDEMIALLGTDSDPAVARELGIHESSVGTKRRQLRIPSFHPPPRHNVLWYPWKPEELARLGKVSDRELADALGLTKTSVLRKRRLLGIPPFQPGPRGIEWTPAMIERLGQEADIRIAGEYGISVSTVSRKRKALGIPAIQEKLPVERNEEVIALLRLPNTEVKHRTGLSWDTIQRLREDLGIQEGALGSPEVHARITRGLGHSHGRGRPAGSEEQLELHPGWRRRYRWRAEEIALVGTAPDAEIAARVGRTVSAVRKKRWELQPERRPIRPWKPHEIEVLGTAPDSKVAARLGRSTDAVYAKRHRLGIPPFPGTASRRWTAAD